MLTAKPHLLTRRPSPTTAEFIISTSPTLSLPQRILLLVTTLLRLLIGLSVLLLLYSKWSLSLLSTPIQTYEVPPAIFTDDFIWYSIQRIHESSLGNTATRLASKIPVVVLVPTAFMLLYAIFLRIHTTESLLVLRGLGIQTSSSAATYLSTATTRFIPTEKIQDIFINEAFRGFEVRYYLVIVVEGEEEVVVCFPRLLPRRKLVETVWRGVRGCLYEPESVPEKGKR